jgi:hypothetical protein
MKFLLITYLDEKAWMARSESEKSRVMASVSPHVEQLTGGGKFISGAPLYPTAEAVTVRLRDGQALKTDGPYAETREQVGGYTLIDAGDREEAVAIASGFLRPEAPGAIEVRAVVEGAPCEIAASRAIASKAKEY